MTEGFARLSELDESHQQLCASQAQETKLMSLGKEAEPRSHFQHRLRIGFVLHIMQVAGAEMLVTEIVRRTRGRLEPTIFCLDGIGPLGEQLRGEGVEVIDLNRRPGLDYRIGLADEPADPAP